MSSIQMARYASHTWKPFNFSGGNYTSGPRKFVIHTTEGSTAAGAFAAYEDGGVPHFTWVLPSRGAAKYQHIDTAVAASALRNESGGVQTNRDSAIQVEIVGFSKDTRYLDDDDLKWLGDAIREVCEREAIDWHKAPTFYDGQSGFTLATPTARQRMSEATWDAYNGVCGHQHVPENSHWDPGALDYPRLLQLQEEDMPTPAEIAKAVWAFQIEQPHVAGSMSPASSYLKYANYNAAIAAGKPTADQIADAVVAALPSGAVDAAVVKAAVKEALREGTGS